MARKSDFFIARMRKVERSINNKTFQIRQELIRIKELNDSYPENDQLFDKNLKVDKQLEAILLQLKAVGL